MIEVLKTSDIEEGQMKAVKVRGIEVLVARSGDNYFAAHNRCPHRGGRLSEGILHGTVVECPLHGSQFDLVDGSPARWLKGGIAGKMVGLLKSVSSSNKLRIYRVEADGDSIKIDL